MPALNLKILDLLVQNNLLTPQQLEAINNAHRETGKKISAILLEKKIIQERLLVDFISNTVSIPYLNLSELKVNLDALAVIPEQVAKEYGLLPISKDGQSITLLLSSHLVALDVAQIKELQDYIINPVIAQKNEVYRLIERYYASSGKPAASEGRAATEKKAFADKPTIKVKSNMEDILANLPEISSHTKEEFNLADITQKSQEAPIIKATNLILEKAIELKASDILIEPLETAMRIRLRIDGMLHQTETLPISIHPFVVSRIKVISNLDIAEHRLPQDGQFRAKISDREVDFRVSTINSSTGEKVAIRVLDKSMSLLDIEKLGLRQEALAKLKASSEMPNGMILVCGPTGSGKTTTLYSILKHIHTPEKNIVTVEDPVEYQIKGINQVSINLKMGLTFSRCLRAILRQDPDVIMIGEIRDFDTMDIAIKAALTGHLVLSTLHTTTAAGSIVRLLDMNVQPFLINASLIAVVSQRLARRICTHCREQVPGEPYYVGRGCKDCLNSGYSGRVLISEILHMSSLIKESILSGRLEEEKIKEISRKEGMKTLREEAESFALAGIISREEVLRVTPAD